MLAELASQYMVSGRGESAIAAATDVIDNAPTQAHRSRSFAANMLGGTRLHQGHIDEGLAHYERARIEADGDVDALLRYHINLSDGLFMLGRHADAVALAESGLAIAAQAGVERTSGAILALNTLDPLFALGHWERADQLIDRSLDLDPPSSYRVYLRRAKIRSLLWHGDVETALWLWRGWTESLSAVAKWEEQTRSSQALDFADLHLAADDLDTAWEFAGQLLGDPRLGTPAQELPVAAPRRGSSASGGAQPETRRFSRTTSHGSALSSTATSGRHRRCGEHSSTRNSAGTTAPDPIPRCG